MAQSRTKTLEAEIAEAQKTRLLAWNGAEMG